MINIVHILTIIWLAWCSLQDIKSKTIHMKSILVGCIIFIVSIIFISEINLISRLFASFVGGFFLALSWITRENIGMGDGIVITIIAISYGLHNTISILFLSFLLLFLLTIVLMSIKKVKGKDRIPFIPFLLLGFVGSIL